MEYILVIFLCLAVGEIDIPVDCAVVTTEHRYLTDCRDEEQAYRDRAIDLAYLDEQPVLTFRIEEPCVRTGEA